jgi:hypothetical protein
MAVPLSATVWGLLAALSVIVSVRVRGLFAVEVGAMDTLMVQVALTATVWPSQLLVCVKSFDTLMAGEPKASAAEPLFVIVTVCAPLVQLTS